MPASPTTSCTTLCAPCHRPGQSAPFALLTFADAKRHAKQMAEVTARHEMPPWLPVEVHDERAALDLRVAEFDDRSGAIKGLRALRSGMKRSTCDAELPPV